MRLMQFKSQPELTQHDEGVWQNALPSQVAQHYRSDKRQLGETT